MDKAAVHLWVGHRADVFISLGDMPTSVFAASYGRCVTDKKLSRRFPPWLHHFAILSVMDEGNV